MAYLSAGVRSLHPGYFAYVMATGIISSALWLFGQPALSLALLYLGGAGYIALVVASIWRLAYHRQAMVSDWHNAARIFGNFTFVAASNVLSARFAAQGVFPVALAMALVGALAWLVLAYAVPGSVMLRSGKAGIGSTLNGAWLIWVVATQSVAIALLVGVSASSPLRAGVALAAFALWAIGVVIYVLLISMISLRLLLLDVDAADLTAPYWVTMGATAISVLAGAHLAGAAGASLAVAGGSTFVGDASLALWAFGSWWIPLLVGFGIWRHIVRRDPLRYEPTLWSMVFPLGMYAMASASLGAVLHLRVLVAIGRAEIWLALTVWLLVFGGMLRSWCVAGRAG